MSLLQEEIVTSLLIAAALVSVAIFSSGGVTRWLCRKEIPKVIETWFWLTVVIYILVKLANVCKNCGPGGPPPPCGAVNCPRPVPDPGDDTEEELDPIGPEQPQPCPPPAPPSPKDCSLPKPDPPAPSPIPAPVTPAPTNIPTILVTPPAQPLAPRYPECRLCGYAHGCERCSLADN